MADEKKRVLIVEDDAFIREIYHVKLTKEGFDVDIAENGIEAIKKIQQKIPDIVLLDVVMPYMDGMTTLKNIKENSQWRNIKIIMLTNISEKEKIDESMQNGVNEYLIKSHFNPSEVVEKVKVLLDE